jgi:hypothetical protein
VNFGVWLGIKRVSSGKEWKFGGEVNEVEKPEVRIHEETEKEPLKSRI